MSHLKNMINNIVGGKTEEATLDLHNFIGESVKSLLEASDKDEISLSQAEVISKKLRDAAGNIKGDAHYDRVLKRLEDAHGKEVADAFDSCGDHSGDKLHYQQKISEPHKLLIDKHAAIIKTIASVK